MQDEQLLPEGPAPRPTVITIFAILTLVNVGFGLIAALVGNLVNFGPEMEGMEALQPTPAENIATVLITMVKGAGAIMILMMRKIGVYLYTATEVILTGLGVYMLLRQLEWLDENFAYMSDLPFDPSITYIAGVAVSIIFSIVWIAVYFSHIGKMR